MERKNTVAPLLSGRERVFHGEFSKPKRENFGPGDLGQKAYDAIVNGSPCESIVGRSDDGLIRCGNPSIMTVDFYILSFTDTIPVCGLSHQGDTKMWIIQEQKDQGRTRLEFGLRTNGF